ncbi:MAG: hypothetical protein HC772_10375 [Leptolyngbyaceae cyanobacterium CRU_2_3]|nr:hypothetical protein [Leptolyngbyaceae cyanobacterium CRU_2_3]
MPQVSTGFLVKPETIQASTLSWEGMGDRLQILGVNFIAPQWQMLETEGLARISDHFPLWVWTVNQPDVIEQLFTHPEIAAIVTDYPDLALKLRSREGSTR